MPSHLQRVRTIGDWTILIPSEFEFIDNDDSWQAHNSGRTVYVSSVVINGPDGEIPDASEMLAIATKAMTKIAPSEHFWISEPGLAGEAEIIPEERGWRLQGVVCWQAF